MPVDERVAEMIQDYKQDAWDASIQYGAGRWESDRGITVADRPERILGTCFRDDGEWHIEIDPEVFEEEEVIQRVVVYHELFHCVYGMEHSDDKLYIMSPLIDTGNPNHYIRNWEPLLKREFDRVKLELLAQQNRPDTMTFKVAPETVE